MEYRQLGDSDIRVSEISLGCWTLGGPNWSAGTAIGWADVDETEAIRAVHYGLDRGVNHFDNADVYGNGRAERLLAKALGPRRKDVVVATKVGHFPGTAEHAYDALHIRHQCEQSLRNLNTDFIDLYYFHHGDFGPGDHYLDGALECVQRLRDEGKIRLIGLSAYSEDAFARLVPRIRPTVLQSWAHLMDDRFIRPGGIVEKLLAEYRMSFVAFSPLNQGILLGRYGPENPPQFPPGDHRRGKEKFAAPALRDVAAKLDQVKRRFGAGVQDLARVAQQFILGHPNVACVIPGFRDQRQVECNLAAAGRPLSAEDIEALRVIFAS